MDRPIRARTAPRRFTDGTYDANGTSIQPKTLKSKAQAEIPARSSSRCRKATQRYDPEDDDGYDAQWAGNTKKSKSGKAKTTGKKKPKRPTNAKKVTHTDNGTPVVNATISQIRKGMKGKQKLLLVRIPQVVERSKLYEEAAKVIGEREAIALPYHGGRMWKVEVRVSDANGSMGSNKKAIGFHASTAKSKHEKEAPAKKTNYKELTPLFRWYRGSLVLATMPYILDDIVEVGNKMQAKKRWANGLKNDEEFDSSDEEWEDERFIVEPETAFTMEASALTDSAYEDSYHPMPTITRSWISPDLQRFGTRKSALQHVDELVKRDLLIDRSLYGYGHNGARLRPVKPTRKQGLEAGMARFLRDGLWVVNQEEMWISSRRDVLVKKQEKMVAEEAKMGGEIPSADGDRKPAAKEAEVSEEEISPSKEDTDQTKIPNEVGEAKSESKPAAIETLPAGDEGAQSASSHVPAESKTAAVTASTLAETGSVDQSAKAVTDDSGTSDNSFDDGDKSPDLETKPSGAESEEIAVVATKRAKRGVKPPPVFKPSTHYCLKKDQIDLCHAACIEHYEKVMHTVKARSLYLELADGFDVLRERGRGRYDMELAAFDTDQFSFLTDNKKAAWMPIIHKLLGEDAVLSHKGCFLSLKNSDTQVYHQDGVHLSKKFQKPCHAVNVFIPLLDMEMQNGPTEFSLGSHYLGYDGWVKENLYTPCVKAGTPIIFDYRLGHRGLGNRSDVVRPVVYLTYSAAKAGKEFRDEVNFSRKRYKRLGEFAEPSLTRDERAKKRKFC